MMALDVAEWSRLDLLTGLAGMTISVFHPMNMFANNVSPFTIRTYPVLNMNNGKVEVPPGCLLAEPVIQVIKCPMTSLCYLSIVWPASSC